jgi:hypothetical protein
MQLESQQVSFPTSRFSKNPHFSGTDPRERGRGYAKECEKLLNWNEVSLTTIQACVLLGAIAITNGNPASENIHYAVACRIAQLLDLPNCQATSRVEQEVNIRSTLCEQSTRMRCKANQSQCGGPLT